MQDLVHRPVGNAMRAGKLLDQQAAILFNIGGNSSDNVGSSLRFLCILMAQIVGIFASFDPLHDEVN
jgi:hypothetical protein